MNPTLYYSDKIDKAIALSLEMMAEDSEVTLEWVKEYWHLLGYDSFFIREIEKGLS